MIWQLFETYQSSNSRSSTVVVALVGVGAAAAEACTLYRHLRPWRIWAIQGGPKNRPFLKCMTHVYDEAERRSIYQNVKLFLRSKTNIRNVAIFNNSWHKFGETILHRKYQLI